MYSHRELIRLAVHKTALRRRIASRRATCAAAAARVLAPVAWLERMLALGRKLAPFAPLAAVPLGFLLKRSPAAKPRLLGTLLRWGPVLFGAVRGLAGARPPRD
ncbi:hypothetical protein [Opitutus sp. GAS368]|uniref:hypothetical protein n=1 Tax=Opitutus sp. GAS368 TaxID=1882749 RepID=UPI00087C798E|nr:hypothetical protein [Opitutus sp. GAS368]SDS13715.1 hypothetical protein SAMN05444173_1995 [Opitutus sp. GAS368]